MVEDFFSFFFSKRMKKIFPSVLLRISIPYFHWLRNFFFPFSLSNVFIEIKKIGNENICIEIKKVNYKLHLMHLHGKKKILSPKFTNWWKARKGGARENSFKKEMKRSFFQNKDRYIYRGGGGEEGWF